MTDKKEQKCPRCLAEVSLTALFCSNCGWDFSKSYQSSSQKLRALLVVLPVSVGLWWAIELNHPKLLGVKPGKTFEAHTRSDQSYETPELEKLRAAVEHDPENLTARRAYIAALSSLYSESEGPPQALLFDLMDALSELLKRDQNDASALLAFANLSFDQQVFDKAVSLYARYLALKPDENLVRARYGSALAFVKRFDEAVSELNQVLAKEPQNFHARAFLAVAYQQMGDIPAALKAGNEALQHAPSEEGKVRLSQFLKSLEQKDSAPSKSEGSPIDGIVDTLKQNPIAGPKFLRYEVKDGVLSLLMKDFPMDQMPPFARDKFLSGIRASAKDQTEVKEVLIIDADTGSIMERLQIHTK